MKIDVWKYIKTILMGQLVEFCDDHSVHIVCVSFSETFFW